MDITEDDRPTVPYGAEEQLFAREHVVTEDDESDDGAWWNAQRRRALLPFVSFAVALACLLAAAALAR